MNRRMVNGDHGGDVLVVPKRHVEIIYDLDDETAAALMQSVAKVARAIRDVFQPEGLSIWQSNGKGAGQEVPHVHMHVLARMTHDELLRVYPESPTRTTREEREVVAAKLRTAFE